MTLNDVERLFDVKICFQPAICCRIDASFGAHCKNLNPYYQRQKCRPMNLVSENIRFMRKFAGVPLGAGVKPHWGLSTTAIFGDLGGYVFENFTGTASNNMWRYTTPCQPANDCKVNDLERLFHDKMRFRPAFLESERLNVRNSTTMRFCGVVCIARSVSQPR